MIIKTVDAPNNGMVNLGNQPLFEGVSSGFVGGLAPCPEHDARSFLVQAMARTQTGVKSFGPTDHAGGIALTLVQGGKQRGFVQSQPITGLPQEIIFERFALHSALRYGAYPLALSRVNPNVDPTPADERT